MSHTFTATIVLSTALGGLTLLANSPIQFHEILAKSSDRVLEWNASGVARLGYGSCWYEPEYPLKGWSQGKSPFGFGTFDDGVLPSAIQTELTSMKGQTCSLYLRTTLDVDFDALQEEDALEIQWQVNDGAILWINGQEILRDNAGPKKSWVYHDQGAPFGTPTHLQPSGSSPISSRAWTLPRIKSLLKPGRNHVAIQVLNHPVPTRLHEVKTQTFKVLDHPSDLYFRTEFRLRPQQSDVRLLIDDEHPWQYYAGPNEPSGGLLYQTKSGFHGSHFEDWIELYNTSDAPVSLKGWCLSDSKKNPFKFRFPASTTIGPHEYLLVVCDGSSSAKRDDSPFLHANFKIQGLKETLVLSDDSHQVVDQIALQDQRNHISYGRSATGAWAFFTTPTPQAPNEGAALPTALPTIETSHVSGHYDQAIELVLHHETPEATLHYTIDGSEPTAASPTYTRPLRLNQSTAIQAKAFAQGSLPSPTLAHTYLIQEPKERRHLKAYCLIADEGRSLYKPYGVMAIHGGPFTSLDSQEQTRHLDHYWHRVGDSAARPSNREAYNFALGHGSAFERPAFLQVLKDGAPLLSHPPSDFVWRAVTRRAPFTILSCKIMIPARRKSKPGIQTTLSTSLLSISNSISLTVNINPKQKPCGAMAKSLIPACD